MVMAPPTPSYYYIEYFLVKFSRVRDWHPDCRLALLLHHYARSQHQQDGVSHLTHLPGCLSEGYVLHISVPRRI